MMKREIYDADHESFRDSVRGFLDREVKPSWDKYIEAKQFPREMWLAFGRQGLLGLEIPEQYGGSAAGDFRYNAVLCEELGKVSMSLGSCHGIHADIVAPYLVELTNEEQRERWLPGFVSGEILTAIAMTEPSGGSDLAALKTTAVREGKTVAECGFALQPNAERHLRSRLRLAQLYPAELLANTRRRRLDPQRIQDLHHQRVLRRPGGGGGSHRPGGQARIRHLAVRGRGRHGGFQSRTKA